VPIPPLFEVSPAGRELLTRANVIADDVAAKHAHDVDTDARFPHEAMAALREARLLGAYVPTALGGAGATIADLAAVCHTLGRRCSATAMVYAMHQIQVACLVHHGQGVEGLRATMRDLAAHQLLLASATTEVGVGGDVRTSRCAVDLDAERFSITKEAPVISYADHADAIMVTARRSADAAPSDQVIVVVPTATAQLAPISTWDTLGMRGTCSIGYTLTATGSSDQVLPAPYAEISAQTMLPVSHIVWAAMWLGIATDAVDVARSSLRTSARRSAGDTPAIAPDIASLHAELETVRATVSSAVRTYEAVRGDPAEAASPTVALRMNALKVSTSTAVKRIVLDAVRITGITAYRNDSPSSLGRHLRDALSAELMVHNERILANSGRLLCVHKGE
jgi:acyl-CoA dehydrogenase